MPPTTSPPPNQSKFNANDGATFRKLVALFDSPNVGEAETAFRKAMLVCVRGGYRFCDAVTQSYGLDELLERLNQRESQGEQLANALEDLQQEFFAYQRKAEEDIQRLTQRPAVAPKVRTQKNQFCIGCEAKRRILGGIAAVPIALIWFKNLEWNQMDAWVNLLGLVFAACPLLGVLLRWRLLIFIRKYSWISWTDNDVYRAFAARWNAFLNRLSMN